MPELPSTSAPGFASVAISVTVGTLLGLTSGFFGGWVDSVVMRLADVVATRGQPAGEIVEQRLRSPDTI